MKSIANAGNKRANSLYRNFNSFINFVAQNRKYPGNALICNRILLNLQAPTRSVGDQYKVETEGS